ncbi:dnaJ homolog subfamily C member 9 isoform X1 [Odocoileus virginianus]|uniref:DnaJ homolog subfamily C member 9 isoform X1 n=1 Tax=Odocoileus virginianus TaxID=9874 RepID=A0ABM4IGG5_ODOVR
MDCSLPGSSVQSMEFSRQEYKSGLPFLSPVDLPHWGIDTRSPALQADSSPSELQGSPYRFFRRQVHPDRVGEDDKEDATRRFQILGKVYSVLSDKEQRALYDEQGTVDEDSDVLSQDRDWEAYWRLLFKKISLEDIQAFEKTYKGSEEELTDIKQAYLDFKGDMDQIMESVLCVQYTEEPRIRHIIQQAIDAGEVPSYNAFVKESKQKMNARKRRAEEEAKEAEMSRKELGLDEGVDNLKAAIQSRQKDRQKEMDNFLAQMEAKYCKPSKRGGKKTTLKKEKK